MQTHLVPARFCPPLPPRRLCRDVKKTAIVILSGAKNLKNSMRYKLEILRLTLQNDITTQPPAREMDGLAPLLDTGVRGHGIECNKYLFVRIDTWRQET